jgi:hypothetical protein
VEGFQDVYRHIEFCAQPQYQAGIDDIKISLANLACDMRSIQQRTERLANTKVLMGFHRTSWLKTGCLSSDAENAWIAAKSRWAWSMANGARLGRYILISPRISQANYRQPTSA